MHRASGVHPPHPWKFVLPATLLALAVGCGGSEVATGSSPGGLQASGPDSQAPGDAPLAPAPATPPGTAAPAPVDAEPQARDWFLELGGPQDDTGTGLSVDGAGDISLVWQSTPREDDDREPVPGQRRGITLARYAPDGTVRWTRDYSRMRVASPGVAASPSGEVFLSGNAFLYPLDFGLGAANDGFVVKFSTSGEPLWQRRVGQKVYGLAADGDGGALVAAEEWTPDGHVPVLAHHDSAGAFVWTRQLDVVAPGSELYALALAPSGQTLLAGRLEGALTVDGHAFGRAGSQGLVLLAFDKDGSLAWGREVRGVDGHVSGLKVDANGGVVLSGEFRGSLPWGGTTLTGPGAFVLAAGPDGAERWAQSLACGARPASPVVAVDERSQVAAVCGDVLSTYAPDGTQNEQHTLTPGECSEGDCPVTGTALGVVPGRGLTLTGWQRHGGADWNQEAFLRLLVL